MTNDESIIPNAAPQLRGKAGLSNELIPNRRCSNLSSFRLRYSFVIRHWSFVILFILCSLVLMVDHLQAGVKEFRGVWVATVYNLDWPSKPGLSAATQQAQLRALLDRAAS